MVGKAMASMFLLGLVGWLCALCRRGTEVLTALDGYKERCTGAEGVLLPSHAKRSPGLVPSTTGVWEYQEAATLDSDWHLFPTAHSSGRHVQALWAGHMGKEQLESGDSNSQSHMVTVVYSFGDLQT